MSIRIENHCETRLPFDVDATIHKLITVVPREHLVGLDIIILVDQVTHKRGKNAAGIYQQKHGHEPATIQIGLKTIYRGLPRIFPFLPFVNKFLLARTLYHEIGHHYQRLVHGVKKKDAEQFAENYSLQMQRKAFYWWRVFLYPLAPIIRWLDRSVNKDRLDRDR